MLAQDDLAQSLLPRWVSVDGSIRGERGSEGFHVVRDGAGGLAIEPGEVGRRLLRSFRHAAAAAAWAGSDVLVDECAFDDGAWARWQEATSGLRATWVQVACELAECERRERLRPDRALLVGLARGQQHRVHTGFRYDLTVDLTTGDVDAAARAVLGAVEG